MPTQDVYALFMESLKNRMAIEGVTQKDLAKRVETSKTHLNTVLKGKKRAGSKLQKRLAAYFRLSLQEMVQEGYNLVHGEQPAEQKPYPDKSTAAREGIYLASYTQEHSNLTDLALELAAAAKKTQDDLAKWQSVVEAIGEGVVIVSAKDQVIEYQNQAHKDMFGETLVGKKCGDAANCPSEDESPTKRALATGRVCQGRFSVAGKTLAIIASPVRDGSGQIVRVVTTTRDVSKRQQALDEVVEAEERLLGVISLLGLPVIIFDENNNIIFTNELVSDLISSHGEDLKDLETLIECLRPQINGFDRLETWMRTASVSRKTEQIDVEYKSGRKSTWVSHPIFSKSGRYIGRVGMSGLTGPAAG